LVTRTTDGQALERLRTLFRLFASTQCEGRSALYAHLGHGLVEEESLLWMLLAAPPSQRRPSLLLASVNHLLGEYRDDPLAAYYPIHGGDRQVDDQALPAFHAFCTTYDARLRDLLATRNTQTNEIRRCFALRLGLARIAELWPGRPVALLEIGASAGLNLAFDAYAYRVGGQVARPGGDSPVTLSTVLRGGGSVDGLLGALPAIEYRMGADLDPVDLGGDPEAARWLEAFIWPEQVEELAVAQLATAARDREVAWLFTEAPGLITRTDVTAPALRGPLRNNGEVYAVGVSLRSGSDHDDEVLALAHPYLEWIAPAREPADDFSWRCP
jgi:Uncharacterized protein conserved in bacteria (DUF2332)